MLVQVQTKGCFSNHSIKLHDAEDILLSSLAQSVVRILDVSHEANSLLNDVRLTQQDFVWFDKSNLFYRLSETNIDWPALIEDHDVQRFYHLISYMKCIVRHGNALKPVQLKLV